MARRILLTRLTDQPRTRAELAAHLATKGVPAEVATRILDRFTEVGLIDDAAYARAWIGSRLAGRGLARRALAAELRRKGVPDEIARAALDEVDPDDEIEAARRLVRRKLRTTAGLAPQVRTRRLVAMLARKGFGAGIAYAVVREEVAEAADLLHPAGDLDPAADVFGSAADLVDPDADLARQDAHGGGQGTEPHPVDVYPA